VGNQGKPIKKLAAWVLGIFIYNKPKYLEAKTPIVSGTKIFMPLL